MDVTVSSTGPLFDGRFRGAMDGIVEEIVDVVASYALERVHHGLDKSIRHPTPYYETQITQQRISATEEMVHDRGIVYGPWLEGTSRRNQTSRFKGYRVFQTVRHQVEQHAPELAGQVVSRNIAKLGG